MTKFLFVFRSARDPHYKMTPEQQQQNHERWQKWLGDGKRSGWVVEPGDGLKQEGRMVDATLSVTDGPFADSKELVGGFTIMQAETLDAAAEIAKGCPMFQPGGTGGTVEVRPLWGFVLRE